MLLGIRERIPADKIGKNSVDVFFFEKILTNAFLEGIIWLGSNWYWVSISWYGSNSFDIGLILTNFQVFRRNVSLVNTENLATTEFDPQLAVVFDIRLRSTNGNGKSPNVSQNQVNWTSTPADRILPLGNGCVLGSSKFMSKMGVNPYRDRAKSFYQRYVVMGKHNPPCDEHDGDGCDDCAGRNLVVGSWRIRRRCVIHLPRFHQQFWINP